jgi:hypothetical protein
MMPSNDSDTVGFHVVILLILHFWPTIVLTFVVTPQYSEHIAAFWYTAIVIFAKYITWGLTILFVWIVLISPVILWVIYLAIYDPIDVYNIAPQYAHSWTLVFFVAMATLFFSQIFLGWYLDMRLRRMTDERRKKIEAQAFPKSQRRKRTLKFLHDAPKNVLTTGE